ncbi:hypothetical protein INT44_002361 [Umbelopsis vinacea]|uniref:AGC-kinase C-terminal domain-containing protein n=1 Tax=Umbelopsis vinacea TaxID=44442 RepID=A0A8H7Q476_9FUNG|nr:hypothetical protein INT44_002361 [Umbelopsis vinacea]
MFTTRHSSSPLSLFDTRYHQLSDDSVYMHKPPRSWSERVQKMQTLLRQQDLPTCSQNEVLLDALIATWDDHRPSIKPLSNTRKETSICLKRYEETIDTLKDLCLQLDDFEVIKPLAKGQFGTESLEFSDEYPISADAKDVISRFLCKKEKRLGCNGNTEDIKSHPFFAGIDWDHIRESSPDDTSNFSVHEEEDDLSMPADAFPSRATQGRKELEGRNAPFIGYTFLDNVGVSINEPSSRNIPFNREEEILRLKRQLESTFRTTRPPPGLKLENPLDQPSLHSSQWIPKPKLQP